MDLVSVVERADGNGGFAAHITGNHTLDRDFTELSASDLQTGELQFGLPAALVVLLLVVGTLVGAAIPMMMAILSIVVALGVTAVIGQVFELNLFIVNMIVAMGLALGSTTRCSSSPACARSATAAATRAKRSSSSPARPRGRSSSAASPSRWR